MSIQRSLGNDGDHHVNDYLKQMQTENPSFFYAIQCDSEQYNRNIFWVDPSFRMNYSYFSDIVKLNTSYGSTNLDNWAQSPWTTSSIRLWIALNPILLTFGYSKIGSMQCQKTNLSPSQPNLIITFKWLFHRVFPKPIIDSENGEREREHN
uniref:Protein FAR1-RELATED SEQUENCE n=1 Tax=Lactuca sativa TaxID=4236 RepID=A0A9R1WW26_LACSA|nr:hypothetical protein LSAT_V11C900492390 [Lactuca sativa]